jgi:hypothetical protein
MLLTFCFEKSQWMQRKSLAEGIAHAFLRLVGIRVGGINGNIISDETINERIGMVSHRETGALTKPEGVVRNQEIHTQSSRFFVDGWCDV